MLNTTNNNNVKKVNLWYFSVSNGCYGQYKSYDAILHVMLPKPYADFPELQSIVIYYPLRTIFDLYRGIY